MGGIVSLGAGLERVWDQPTVGVRALDNTGAAQCLQAANMALDIGVVIPAGHPYSAGLGNSSVLARAVFAGASGEFGYIAIGWTR